MPNKEDLIRQANALTHRRVNWTPLMTQCYVRVLWNFEQRLSQFQILQPKNIFGDPDYSYLTKYVIPIDELDADHIDNYKTAFRKLQKELMEFGDATDPDPKNAYACYPFLSGQKWNPSNKTFNVEVPEGLIPYLIDLKQNYTAYDALTAMQFSGKYTERFYELCSKYRAMKSKTFFVLVDELRAMFKFSGRKYENIADLQRFVLTPSQEEMKAAFDNSTCDIYFMFWIDERDKVAPGAKGGRPKVDRVRFAIHEKRIKQDKIVKPTESNLPDRTTKAQAIFNMLGNIFGGSNPYYKSVIMPISNAIIKDLRTADKIIDFLQRARKDRDVERLPGYVRAVLKDEFGIEPMQIKSK